MRWIHRALALALTSMVWLSMVAPASATAAPACDHIATFGAVSGGYLALDPGAEVISLTETSGLVAFVLTDTDWVIVTTPPLVSHPLTPTDLGSVDSKSLSHQSPRVCWQVVRKSNSVSELRRRLGTGCLQSRPPRILFPVNLEHASSPCSDRPVAWNGFRPSQDSCPLLSRKDSHSKYAWVARTTSRRGSQPTSPSTDRYSSSGSAQTSEPTGAPSSSPR